MASQQCLRNDSLGKKKKIELILLSLGIDLYQCLIKQRHQKRYPKFIERRSKFIG
jgi:hypothetical protein